jgi:hypothetical protein
MNGERLHAFDLELTSYVLDNLHARMGDPAFAAFLDEQVEAPVLAYLSALASDDEPPALLLSDAEIVDLSVTFLNAAEFDHRWEPYEALHRRSLESAPEIRDALGAACVHEWTRASARCAERLESGRVRLSGGIEAVHEWIQAARRLLRGMGAVALLPPPDGTFPTPTCPDPTPPPSAEAPPLSSRQQADETLTAALTEIRDLLINQRRVQEFYSPGEAAALLGKAEFTVREWCRLGRVHAEKRRSGRGRSLEWVISHAELVRIQREGLLPQPKTSTRLR